MSVSLSSVVEGFLNNCCLAPASAALVRPTDGCSSTIHQTDTHIQSAGNTAQIITSAYPSTSSVGSTQTLETHTGTTRIETTDALAPQQRHQTSSNPVQLSCDTKQIQTTTIELPTPSPTITQPEVSPAIAPAELSPTSMPPVSPPAGVASVLNYLYTGQLPLHHSALYQVNGLVIPSRYITITTPHIIVKVLYCCSNMPRNLYRNYCTKSMIDYFSRFNINTCLNYM